MKVGFVLDTSFDPNDGVQQYVMSVGEWLRAEGHDVHYLVGETHERDLPNIHSLCKNITVKFNGNKTTIPVWANRKKLRAFLNEQQFDVLHVQTPHHPFMAQFVVLEKTPQTVVVGSFHILPCNTVARVANKLLGYILRPSLKRFDAMLAVSSTAKEFEEWSFHVPATVSPDVFDYDRFTYAKAFNKYRDGKLNILFLGRLVERKGCKYLLEAVAQLDRTQLPDLRVIVCGKGALQAELEKFVSEQGLQDIVEFTGFVTEEDKPRYYASADISVFPSVSGESFGIVLLEAMASGNAAVLAGDNPGYATVMEPKQELLFNPKDITKLTELLTEYITDASKRQAIASWGKTYTQKFDVKVVGPQVVGVYEAAISAHKEKDATIKL